MRTVAMVELLFKTGVEYALLVQGRRKESLAAGESFRKGTYFIRHLMFCVTSCLLKFSL